MTFKKCNMYGYMNWEYIYIDIYMYIISKKTDLKVLFYNTEVMWSCGCGQWECLGISSWSASSSSLSKASSSPSNLDAKKRNQYQLEAHRSVSGLSKTNLYSLLNNMYFKFCECNIFTKITKRQIVNYNARKIFRNWSRLRKFLRTKNSSIDKDRIA